MVKARKRFDVTIVFSNIQSNISLIYSNITLEIILLILDVSKGISINFNAMVCWKFRLDTLKPIINKKKIWRKNFFYFECI